MLHARGNGDANQQRDQDRHDRRRAQGYALERALNEYKIKYHTYPTDLRTLVDRISDPDGTLAAAVANIDPITYHTSADLAANGNEKGRRLRGTVIRKVSLSSETDDTPSGGIAFTTYSLILPGEDKITGTEDDWIVEDGMIRKQSDAANGGVGRSVSAGVLQP